VEDTKDYLGDGVYVIYDGFSIRLHANDIEFPTDTIYLEPEVLIALNDFAIRVGFLPGGAKK
jgi:hypothetical protein